MALDTKENRDSLIEVFPDLDDDPNFRILSPTTRQYNCIAWAMGYTNRWVQPFTSRPEHWWPDGVEHGVKCECLVAAFRHEGFEDAFDGGVEDGFDKVALYKKPDKDVWTHASRIIARGIEHSKFGNSFDGQHSEGVLCNTSSKWGDCSYGVVFKYMKRSRAYRRPEPAAGNIEVNLDLLNQMLGMPPADK